MARCSDWPGAHCSRALSSGLTTEGIWFDRTRECAARNRGERFRRHKYASRELLKLDPLPCWSLLSEERHQGLIEELILQIEKESENHNTERGTQPLGSEYVLAQHPHDRPRFMKRTPAPAFHAATKSVRRELIEAYRSFVAVYRRAAQRLRESGTTEDFPGGSFPPQPPFVGWAPALRPG